MCNTASVRNAKKRASVKELTTGSTCISRQHALLFLLSGYSKLDVVYGRFLLRRYARFILVAHPYVMKIQLLFSCSSSSGEPLFRSHHSELGPNNGSGLFTHNRDISRIALRGRFDYHSLDNNHAMQSNVSMCIHTYIYCTPGNPHTFIHNPIYVYICMYGKSDIRSPECLCLIEFFLNF